MERLRLGQAYLCRRALPLMQPPAQLHQASMSQPLTVAIMPTMTVIPTINDESSVLRATSARKTWFNILDQIDITTSFSNQ
ncbi:hypothetical protein SAMN00790413_05573 [Deinococcus hopiensis KR-140]|uniref:Uncharacterized protein n=1 Tax=Deinococcus hopiensis KR-140 TaxID=695939 RepID=A0A1W1UHJ5_9DEIO|nr:hypothetical protein SAMN00790413_05573 [Deinococcus hopiensis KR-140]